MPSLALRFISFFRRIVLAVVTATLVSSAALPLRAQNSVPPTAMQAARMPQYAAKLAHGASRVPHPVPPNASYKRPGDISTGTKHGWLPQGNDLYDNGPVNGTTDAWTINFGFVISDSFDVGAGSTVSGLNFYAWTYPGDVVETVEVAITSSEFGGTTYFDQTVSFNQSSCSTNQYGFNVCLETSQTFNGPDLSGGTYWVNLENAVVNDGDPLYWDENSGPSLASGNSIGTIPSESFTVEGDCDLGCTPQCFQSGGILQVLYNFTTQQEGGTGVAIDRAGNLYGTTSGGNNGEGFAYKLAHLVDWVLDPLFNFFGGNNGGPPNGAIVGPNGTLYGGAAGGIQNCGSDGSQYCGLVYNLTPPPTVCLTALCGWNENVPYRFSSESDGSGMINVSAYDQQGNLYGTTTTGGTYDAGTVFELTPSAGSWTKATLYSFTGGNDGTNPIQVLAGNDGNLYGVAGGGSLGRGVVFQLTFSGGQWMQSVIHAFGGVDEDRDPGYLVQDSAGNLYGIATNTYFTYHGAIFALQKTGSGWGFSETIVDHNEFDTLNNLTLDTAGNLYGTGYDFSTYDEGGRYRHPGIYESYDSYIFRATYAGGYWSYGDLDYLEGQSFGSAGNLALDSSGNLYGTAGCGTNNAGTVWQLSP